MKKTYIIPELEVTNINSGLILNVLNVSGTTSSLGDTPSADTKVRFDDASSIMGDNDAQW